MTFMCFTDSFYDSHYLCYSHEMTNTEKESLWLASMKRCRNLIYEGCETLPTKLDELSKISQLFDSCPPPLNLSQHLVSFLDMLLCESDLNWIASNLRDFEAWHDDIPLFNVFMKCSPDVALLSLSTSFNKQKSGARQTLCIRLMESYFIEKKFVTLLLGQCHCVSDAAGLPSVLTSKLIDILSSFPEKIANNTSGKFGALFHHSGFFELLAVQTTEALAELVTCVKANKDVSVTFLADMLGQFCRRGRAESFLGVMLPFVIEKTELDFVWRRLCNKLLSSIPERCLEPTVTYLMKNIPWYGCVKWLFADSIIRERKLKYILLHKLLLMKHYTNPGILRNIIGYISSNEETGHLLIETLKKLFSAWADTSAMKHISYEQHKYITEAILICIGHLKNNQCVKFKQDLMLSFMPGMSSHLECPDVSIRRLGMIVGEVFTSKTRIAADDNKLEFDYEKDGESVSLAELSTPQVKPTHEYFLSLADEFIARQSSIWKRVNSATVSEGFESFTTSKSTFMRVAASTIPSQTRNCELLGDSENGETELADATSNESALDSDDDLTPYDMSNDVEYKKVNKPMYIRDCMDGLRQTEDRETVEIYLSSLQNLIESDPFSAKEVSVELCQILLFMENTYALKNFTRCRHASMISLAVVDPEKVAGFLTTEFYAENYGLQVRMDMLDVLAAAAGVLSSVEKVDKNLTTERDGQKTTANEIATSSDTEGWREIVNKRIESKTRRFGKGVKKPLVLPKANRFGPVAGCFFYPLLAGYDRRIRTMDLLGTDSLILGRLLYSIGSIVYSAVNTVAVKGMANSLLEFSMELRFHSEAYVRQATLFCVSMAVIGAGTGQISNEMKFELQEWLEEVMIHDSNTRTQELAAQTRMILNESFKKDLTVD